MARGHGFWFLLLSQALDSIGEFPSSNFFQVQNHAKGGIKGNMKDFKGKIAIVTGAGTGMGRELARQLAAEGCHVAFCDVLEDTLAETITLCERDRRHGDRVLGHPCDVALEEKECWEE
jgi:hypothetical protein